jgi:predicted nuclease of predicted toxin-antitoxin system
MMRFKIDENLHDDVAALLAAHGHDVHTCHTEGLRGCHDDELAERCQREDRVIITLDLDFSDIRLYPPAEYAGIIVLRIADQSKQHSLSVMTRALESIEREPLDKHLWIVTDAAIRIRGA